MWSGFGSWLSLNTCVVFNGFCDSVISIAFGEYAQRSSEIGKHGKM